MEENEKDGKLSYERLEDVARQLSAQLRQAQERINQMSGMLTRLPYLFRIVEDGDKVFSPEFVTSCVEEIEAIMALPEDDSGEKGEGDGDGEAQ